MVPNRRFSRRSFLTQTGAVVAALGLTELAVESGMLPQAKAYSEALAQSTGRKLALLIGIDTYPKGTISPDDTVQLAGAATDVALQKELLIHRFGFLPSDVVCLTNEQATRAGIYQALVTHLCNQAGAKDTVVFHFSGYGAQIRVADLVGGQATQRSLVPYDGVLPTEDRPILNDIFETELKALLAQVKAKNITTVLDAGFVDITVPLSGGLRSRTRPVIATGQPPAPFPRLAKQKNARKSEPFPGTLLRAADTDEVVLERQWDQFNAGAFTYVLTQYLWSAPAPVSVVQAVGRSQETLVRWGGSNQQPIVSGRRKQDFANPAKSTPIYDTPLIETTRAEGVITAVSPDGQKATLWLGGIPPRVLEYLATPAIMTCAGRRLQVRSRTGLKAEARLVEAAGNNGAPLQPGQPIFEGLRALPKTIDLVVALDSTLERIERVDATSALSALSFVSSTSDTELPADCLLAKPLNSGSETLTASLKPSKFFQAQTPTQPQTPESPSEPAGKYGYGLFSLTRSLIPGTLAPQEEAIKPAISRLTAKLQALLALKMLRLSENRASSQLPVRVRLEMTSPQAQPLLSRQTIQGQTVQIATKAAATTKSGNTLNREGFSPEITVGSRIRYQVFNDSTLPLYYTLINVDPRERLSAFCPVMETAIPTAEADTPENTSATTTSTDPVTGRIAPGSIAPGSSVIVPSADLDWAVEAPTGPVETYVVCSTRPLTNTHNTLTAAAANSGGQRISPLPEPLTVIQAILSDISQDDNNDVYTLNVAEWATLNFTYQAM